ncbi:27577_t:CDS:1, partial [Gigaspora margarita]
LLIEQDIFRIKIEFGKILKNAKLERSFNKLCSYVPTEVNKAADILPTLSPKLSSPIASPPKMTVNCSHERNVRSFAKKT